MIHFRYDWLTEIINEKGFENIAEVGLNRCETLNCLMERCPSIKSYVGIDSVTNEYIENSVKKYADKFKFIQGDSTEVGNGIDKTYDLVFVDADHAYEKVLLDLKAWEDKVRPGGIFCGDDYGNQWWPGVKLAVDEHFKDRLGLNIVSSPANVWWIVK